MRVARDVRGFAQSTLAALQGVAAGVSVTGISVDPTTLPFDPAVITLTLTAEDE